MLKLKNYLKIIFLLGFLFLPLVSWAANDVVFTENTILDLLTADTSEVSQLLVSSGGQVSDITLSSNYIDLTIENLSNIQIDMLTADRYFKITKVSGSDDYSLNPTCPTNSLSLTGNGGAAFLRLQVYTTDQCSTPPPDDGGGGGGGSLGPINVLPVLKSLLINDGVAETFSTNVVLKINADNVTQMMISNYPSFLGAVWETYSPEKNWTLLTGKGERIVYIKLKNSQGEGPVETASIQIIGDRESDYKGTGVTGKYSAVLALGQSLTINMDKGLSLASDSLCTSGSLIKLPNDNNPLTQRDSAVYYCGADGKRYVFPNPAVYFTWYSDFSNVSVVNPSLLSNIPLGGNVTSRPGVRMVKFMTDAKTYAVARNGVLRWVEDEETAVALYGSNWNQKIDDVSDVFYLDYTMGDPISLDDVILEDREEIISPVVCTSETFFVEFLDYGSSNSEVLPLQNLLKCLGHFPEDVEANGYFGPTTEASVKSFQEANGIEPVGFVGPDTRAALNEYYSAQ